jgi:DNA polymerase-1
MAVEVPEQQGVLFPEEFGRETGQAGARRAFPTPAYTYVSRLSQLTRLLPRLLAAPALACDTETTGLDCRKDGLRLVQIATPGHVYLFDVYALPPGVLAPVFENDRVWIFHNAKFDVKFLVGAGLPWPRRIFDTMLASQLMTAGLRTGHSLEDVVHRQLDLGLPKAVRTSDWTQAELSEPQRAYAARDVAVLWPLYTRLQAALQDAGLEWAADIEFRCINGLAWLEMRGMGFDAERWLARTLDDEARLADLKHQLDSAVTDRGMAINWLSHQQVKQLFHDFGITLPNTRADTLKKVDHPVARLLVAYKETAKRVNTYGRAVIDSSCDPETGRVYPVYFQNGAATGRMSCGGPNIQQIPKGAAFRACFRAAPGGALIRADYSQIELRIAAALAGDETMLRAFHERIDLHALTASRILQLPLAEVHKQHRQLAKSVNFGLLYGMGIRGLKLDAEAKYGVAMTEAEAARYHQAFFHTYQGLQRWHQQAKRQIEHAQRTQQTLETRTLTGRRFLGVRHFNVLLNIPVQGTGGDGLKLALGRLFEHRHEAPGAFPVACVHDEIVAEVPLSEAAPAAEWLAHHMTAAMQEIIGDRVPIEIETTIGKDWAGAPLDSRTGDRSSFPDGSE